jgi:phosphatidylinositol-3-phosphatase
MPSRRAVGVLTAVVLAIGVLAGVALGPASPGTPADAATLAQQAIAALTTQVSARAPASAPASSTTTPASEPATSASAPSQPIKAASKATSTPVSQESSSASEGSSSGTQSSEGSSSEDSSKGSGKNEKPTPGTPVKLPAVKHVWVITLSGTSFSAALADSIADPYLAKQLVPKGTLLSNYTLSSSSALGNGIALLAGQSVNLDTEQNCPTYTELQPPTVNTTTGLAEGVGCMYPATVKTLADELTAGSLTWKAYVQDMQASTAAGTVPAAATPSTASTTSGSDAQAQSSTQSAASTTPSATSTTPGADTQTQPTTGVTCRRPELGAADPNHVPTPGDPYLTYRNPFVYFDSLLSEGACASNDVDFTQLHGDLAAPANTPSLSWIVPSACNDGSSTPCAPGAPAGLASANSFLEEVVPQILATSTYSKEGLIVIVPDSPPSSPASAASQPVGALLLSPFVHSDTRVSESFNDFSLLKSISLLFGVLPLGHANDPSTASFGATVYGTGGRAASVAPTAKKAAQAASAAQPRRRAAPQTGG